MCSAAYRSTPLGWAAAKMEPDTSGTPKLLLRHRCEVCGKSEMLTPDDAFEAGWDYPPRMGAFRMVSPRTCGNCGIDRTLWWAVAVENKSIAELTESQLQTLEIIGGEPLSILYGLTGEDQDGKDN